MNLTKHDFTHDELTMLKAIFRGAEAAIEAKRTDRYDTYEINLLYDIKKTLGIYDLLEEDDL